MAIFQQRSEPLNTSQRPIFAVATNPTIAEEKCPIKTEALARDPQPPADPQSRYRKTDSPPDAHTPRDLDPRTSAADDPTPARPLQPS